jgi:hypothetical protein
MKGLGVLCRSPRKGLGVGQENRIVFSCPNPYPLIPNPFFSNYFLALL